MPDDRQLDHASLHLRRADQLVPTKTPWLIDGWLVQDTLAGLVGASGSCKSFLALDWACCVATGTAWNGFAVNAGPVCYLAGEGHHGLRKRIAAWEKWNRKSIQGAPLFIGASIPSLCMELNAFAAIEQMIAATVSGPSLIVIDTVARAMGGSNENSTEDMSSFIRSQDWIRTECRGTVLTLHHTGHNPSEQSRARGSSAYRGALDSEFVLANKSEGEVLLTASKCKDWMPPEPMRLRKEQIVVDVDVDEDGESSLILKHLASAKIVVDKRSEVIEMRASGVTFRDIEKATGVKRSTAERWTKEE